MGSMSVVAVEPVEQPSDESVTVEEEMIKAVTDEAEWSRMVTKMMTRYVEWKSVEFSGKISLDILPISVSLKMYMEKNQLIQLSLRAPFLGEIGRIDITPQEILLVNRYNKTYACESMSNIIELVPDALEDVQCLFLGRVVVPGCGQLNENNLSLVTFYGDTADNQWVVYPDMMPRDGTFDYGYLIDPNGRTNSFYAAVSNKKGSALIKYLYSNNSMRMDVNVDWGKKNFDGSLDFSSIRWGGTPMADVNLSGDYRQLPINVFFKQITNR